MDKLCVFILCFCIIDSESVLLFISKRYLNIILNLVQPNLHIIVISKETVKMSNKLFFVTPFQLFLADNF